MAGYLELGWQNLDKNAMPEYCVFNTYVKYTFSLALGKIEGFETGSFVIQMSAFQFYNCYNDNEMQKRQMNKDQDVVSHGDSQGRKIDVIAYSGYKANERPVSFVLEEQKREVKEIPDQWRGQDHDYFKVLADDGCVYLLRWHRTSDQWFCEKK